MQELYLKNWKTRLHKMCILFKRLCLKNGKASYRLREMFTKQVSNIGLVFSINTKYSYSITEEK